MELTRNDRWALAVMGGVGMVCVGLMLFGGNGEAMHGNEVAMDSVDGVEAPTGYFDPNTVDSATLVRYGLGASQIRSLMGYRRHGGRIESPLAVSKLYNWTDEDVEKVLPYIKIGEQTHRYRDMYERELRERYEHGRRAYDSRVRDHREDSTMSAGRGEKYERNYVAQEKFAVMTKVDINVADTATLRKIPGVGSSIANSIVRLRGKLGGFYSVEQLKDIKYISPELYEWMTVGEKPEIHLININKASFQTLNAHPYVSYDQARDLMSYRRMYGEVKDADALIKTRIFTEKEVERLAPYLEY